MKVKKGGKGGQRRRRRSRSAATALPSLQSKKKSLPADHVCAGSAVEFAVSLGEMETVFLQQEEKRRKRALFPLFCKMIMSKAAVLLALVAVGVSGLEVRKASGCAQAPEDPNVPPFPVTHKFPCGHPNITEVSTIGKFYRKVIEGHNQYTLDGAGGDADRTAEARDVKYPKQSSPCKPGADCGEAKDEVKHGQWTEGGIELPNYCKACTVVSCG